MKYTTKFFKEQGAKGGTATSQKLGKEHYSNMGKKSVIARKLKAEKNLSPVVEG